MRRLAALMLAATLPACSLGFSLDEYVRGVPPVGGDGGPGIGSPARVLIFGGQGGSETMTAEFDARGRVTGFTPMYRVSDEWSGAGFFDGEIVVVNNSEVLRAPFDGGAPPPWTRLSGRRRPDGRGSLVVGRGVAIASMGENGQNVWTAELTDAGLTDWAEQPAETAESRRDPRVLTDGTFVWLIGGESPPGTLTPVIEFGRLNGTELATFQATNPLPIATTELALGLSADRLVACGGSTGSNATDRCYSAPLDSMTGQVGPFSMLPALPYGMTGGAIAIVRGRLTLLGAQSRSVPDNDARIFSLDLDGGTEWERAPLTLPFGRYLEDVKVLVP
jgi:hypothetical protein